MLSSAPSPGQLFAASRFARCLPGVVLGFSLSLQAHNLDQVNTHLRFDLDTVNRIESRFLLGGALIQEGDELGLVFKSTPGPGTNVGAGGYFTFYIPPGTQVIGVDYGTINASGAFSAQPLKPPAPMPLGEGPIGASTSSPLIGVTLGPNITGQSAQLVDSSGQHQGTLAGVYGDVGIFYSTDPTTAWRSFHTMGGYDGNPATDDHLLVNNNGDAIIPSNFWDAAQLIAFGTKNPAAPLVDANGRGNAPWGLASPVAGPESGYAWCFDLDYWRSHPNHPQRMRRSIQVGPWQRIRYPGSTVARDQPGQANSGVGLALQDASTLGVQVSATQPLPPTVSWTDSSSPKAIRIAYGELRLGRHEHGRVRLKVLANAGEPNSPFQPDGSIAFHSDVSGGDAGGESNGRDHVWRYVKSSPLSVQTASHFQKTFVKNLVQVGETSHFDLVIVNTGAGSMQNVVVRDPMPSGLSFVSASEAPSGTNPLTWNLGTIPAQGFRRIRVQYTATSVGTRYNVAQMTWQGGTKESMDSLNVTTTGAPDPPASLSVGNLLFLDSNGNGRADAGEGLANIGLELYHADDTPGVDPPRQTQTTGSDGRYLFTGLEADEYKIHLPAALFRQGQPLAGMFGLPGGVTGDDDAGEDSEDAPEPWLTGISTREFHLAEGTAPTQFSFETGHLSSSDDSEDSNVDLTIDLGLFFAVGIGNHVFIDANRNGAADPGEGFDGVTLELYRDGTFPGSHPPLATTTTADGGFYTFFGLTPGSYRVHINKEMFTADTPLYGMVSIPGNVSGDDDVSDDGDALGDLSQTGVTSGLITVTFGSAPTLATGETGRRSEADDHIDAVIDLTVDFGFERPLRIGNLVFNDLNLNGRYDEGEGLPGVTLQLFQSGQDPDTALPLAEAVTDDSGRYEFNFLYPGSYFVRVPPGAFDPGGPLAGFESLPGHSSNQDDDVSEDGIDDPLPQINGILSAILPLVANNAPTAATFETGAFAGSDDADDSNADLTIDFGFRALNPLELGVGNLVFIDRNYNGRADESEGVPDVLVQLFRSGDDPQITPPLGSTVTGNRGNYLFRGLAEGAYFVHIPATEFLTGRPLSKHLSIPGAAQDNGLDDNLDENGLDSPEPWVSGISSSVVDLSVGAEPVNGWTEYGLQAEMDDFNDGNFDLTIDLGFIRPVAVGNLVFIDANGNGRADPGEGVSGVQLRLYPALADPLFDSPLAETTTNAQGGYLFGGLAPGEYFVHIPAWMFTPGAPLENRVSLAGSTPGGDDDVGEDGLDAALPASFGVRSAVTSLAVGSAPAGPAETGFEADSDDRDDESTDLTIDFGFALPASLGALVFHDLNHDGLHQPQGADQVLGSPDDEVALPAVPMEVWFAGTDGLIGGGDDLLIRNLNTSLDGSVLFAGLGPGAYFLKIPDAAFTVGAALEDFPVASLFRSDSDNQTPGDNNGAQPSGRGTAAFSPVIAVSSGESDASLGFGFLASIHPLTWPAWQLRHSSLADTSFAANSDGDVFSNLEEFAFGLSPVSGLISRPPVRIEVDPVTQRVDLCVDRVTDLRGLSLTVELLTQLNASPAGWTAVPSLSFTVTTRPDQTEELRFTDISSHPLFASATQGFARVRLELDTDLNGEPEHVERSTAVGWSRITLPARTQTLSHGFAPFSRFSARIDAVAGTALNVASALNATSPASLLSSGVQSYLEVLSGPLAGHRLEVDESATAATNASLVVDAAHPRHTLPGAPPLTLVGSTIALRDHLTLNALADRSRFRAANSSATSDRVHVFNAASGGFQTYWLFSFGGNPRWVRQGDGSLSDQGALIIEPGRGLFVHPYSNPVTLVLHGQVREHPFACPLIEGPSFVAPGWPMTLSPNAVGLLLANGFTGGTSAARADQLQLWNGDNASVTPGYSGLYLLNVSTLRHWTWMGDSTLSNQSATPLFQSNRSHFIITRKAIPNWIMPLPWSP